MTLLGQRQPRPGERQRRIRGIVVARLDLEPDPVAVERAGPVDVGHGEDRSGPQRHQLCVWPPSATRSCPVTQPASSEARKATAGAMSAATARRGIACSIWTNSNASACLLASTPSVSVSPGSTELTVLPSGPSSRASAGAHAPTPSCDSLLL